DINFSGSPQGASFLKKRFAPIRPFFDFVAEIVTKIYFYLGGNGRNWWKQLNSRWKLHFKVQVLWTDGCTG
ncbi:MAG: hypothetical protein JXR76_06595, partial [Deltaproteobacteria bacterium]|nr:hypothetical protein [Deltaproteobacteria bacterium]